MSGRLAWYMMAFLFAGDGWQDSSACAAAVLRNGRAKVLSAMKCGPCAAIAKARTKSGTPQNAASVGKLPLSGRSADDPAVENDHCGHPLSFFPERVVQSIVESATPAR